MDSQNDFLTTFAQAKAKMIATNDNAYRESWVGAMCRLEKLREYSYEDINAIITSGSLTEQQKLSRTFFAKNGYYKQIIIYYATLLKYMGLLIPNPGVGKKLSTSHIAKRYYSAMDFVERMQLPVLLTNIALRALIDGCYYGLLVDGNKNEFQLIDLPSGYACSRFKDIQGNDIIEFDLSYFNTITDEKQRKSALAAYPSFVAKAWDRYKNNKKGSARWIVIPKEIGVCFPFFEGRPLFLNVIPSTLEYDEAVATQRDRDADEVRKIIVQQIPHLTDGRLLFEPDEAEEIHNGTVGMMKGNKNVSVLTTYGDVEVVASNAATADKVETTLTRLEQNIYAQGGVSNQLFASTGGSSLETSLNNDLALMMYFANKVSRFITNTLNDRFANSNINFKYEILPITYYNTKSFVDTSFRLTNSGYSALVPALALGLTQKDLVNVKDLENNVLKLKDILIPLSTSYTQSGDSTTAETANGTSGSDESDENLGGRPELEEGDKADQTVRNEESKERTGE